MGKRKAENAQCSTSNAQLSTADILRILHKWGIHTLGQLAALDKEQLGARLGPEAIRMWERANGRSSRLLKLIRPPESFEESFEFEHEIETAEPLAFYAPPFFGAARRAFGCHLSRRKRTDPANHVRE